MADPTSTELLAIADALYGLDLGDFTPARDAQAKEHKGTALATQVKALRKPSTAAWVVNVLVRHEAEQVEQILAVGAALREAQANLEGAALRELTRQRRQLTAAVATRARAVAKERGVKVTESVRDQVEATLTAAMIDEGAARAVRSGQLVTALAATGVEAVDLSAAVATPEALGFEATPAAQEPERRPELRVVPDPDADLKALRAAQEALEEAEEALAEATGEYDEAAAAVSELQARELEVQARIDELKRQLAVLEATAEEVEEELEEAEEARAEAESVVTDATRERDAARAKVDALSR